ncbi:MAG: GAF domain-containing protein [Bacillota bacterium]
MGEAIASLKATLEQARQRCLEAERTADELRKAMHALEGLVKSLATDSLTSSDEVCITVLDWVLGCLGLEMGAVWLGERWAHRGISEPLKVIAAMGQAPAVQVVADWTKVEPESAALWPVRLAMEGLDIRASIGVTVEHKGAWGGVVVCSREPRQWKEAEVAPVEMAASVLGLGAWIEKVVGRWSSANRAARVLARCAELLVGAEDETSLFQQVCGLLVDEGGYRLAWVGLAEPEHRTVVPVAWAGEEGGYLRGLRVTWDDSELGRGPTGTAIRTGKPVSVKDVETHPEYSPWRQEARKRGYGSSIALPLSVGGVTIGALNVYAARSDVFSPEETELLVRLADNLSLGIRVLRDKRALDQSELRYRKLVE